MNKNINRVYATYDEKLVKSTILYTDASNLFYDQNWKNKVNAEEATNLFLKGLMLVCYNEVYYRPIACYPVAGGNTTVTIITTNNDQLNVFAEPATTEA